MQELTLGECPQPEGACFADAGEAGRLWTEHQIGNCPLVSDEIKRPVSSRHIPNRDATLGVSSNQGVAILGKGDRGNLPARWSQRLLKLIGAQIPLLDGTVLATAE